MEQLRESEGPVIVLRGGCGVALYQTVPYSPYFYESVHVGDHAVLHPDGQIDMHGTPREEGTFQLAGHWLESDQSNLTLLNPPQRRRKLEYGLWKRLSSFWVPEVTLSRKYPNPDLPKADHIILFGEILIAPARGGTMTRVYPLAETTYNIHGSRIWHIPVGSHYPIPVLP